MRELYRVLKTGGWAILQVPINGGSETTIEDLGINTPELRSRFYGQHDHLRYYGLDNAQRLKEAGFKVIVDKFLQNFDNKARKSYGLSKVEDIYVCTKSPTSSINSALRIRGANAPCPRLMCKTIGRPSRIISEVLKQA